MRFRLTIILFFAAVLILVVRQQVARSFEQETVMEALVFAGGDLVPGEADGMAAVPGGLTVGGTADSGSYTSPVIEAPNPFNALVPEWVVDLPGSAEMQFFLRTEKREGEWGDW